MTYAETAVNQTISRLLSEHPDLDASADAESLRAAIEQAGLSTTKNPG